MKRLTCLILIVFCLLLSACVYPSRGDGRPDVHPEPDIPEEEPKPISVYLDNRAEWDAVYCIGFAKDETESSIKILMEADEYGIYCAEIPGECDRVAFLDEEGNRTPIFLIPDGLEKTYDNSSDSWKLYEDAIANSLLLGENTIRVTSAHKAKGMEYILFYAEKEGIYSFTSDSNLDIKVVITELSSGNWEEGSGDWTSFFTTGNIASLSEGYYYVCLYNSDPSVAVGLHRVYVEYSKSEPQRYPLVNYIFSDGEITVLFIQNNGNIMKVIDAFGKEHVYYYTVTETDGGYAIDLTLTDGSEEYNVNGSFLSELCERGKVFVLHGDLYFLDNKISFLAS